MNYLDTCNGDGCPMRSSCARHVATGWCYRTRGRISADTGEFACQQYEPKNEQREDEKWTTT